MTTKFVPSARHFEDLPEPLRSRAAAFFDELVENGEAEGEAKEKTRAMAENWAKERVPGH